MVERNELDPFIASIANELKRPVRVDPAFDGRVMAALEPSVIPMPLGGERSGRERFRSRPWLLRPHTFSLTPLAGLVAAAALTGIAVLGIWRVRNPADAVTVGPALAPALPLIPASNVAGTQVTPTMISVPFMLRLPSAHSVALVGEFNGWDASKTPLIKISEKDDVWAASVMLPPGRFEYQFVVDGQHRMVDPAAPQTARSDFGDANSVVTVNLGAIR